MEAFHHPVLVREVVTLLNCRPGGIYVDGTVGGGGHTLALLERIGPQGLVVGMDRDEEALREAKRRLASFSSQIILVQGNYRDLPLLLEEINIGQVDGIVYDLGVSSHQLTSPERGFLFTYEGLLDMRMDRKQPLDAATIVNTLPERELAALIADYGEERWAKRIARAIVESRSRTPFTTTTELADLIMRVVPRQSVTSPLNPATRTFLALRIVVNRELEHLPVGIAGALQCLKSGGRFAVISFHSLEDRIVKRAFQEASRACTCPPELPRCLCGGIAQYTLITKRPLRPTPEEIAANPRARSAKLRVIERN